MAFRKGAKEMKKQSYYVWFLGAKESRGLRGLEYIGPVLRFLLEREREVEPPKVTLQVSGKGIKMVQNIARGVRGKMEQVKHLIPQHAVTCVHQDGDLVCCILLLYNPVTRCPVHVHVYRCDSPETATMLRQQLQQLVERPDNQTKFREIEHRLAAKGLLREHSFHHHHHSGPPRMPSDGRTEDGSDDRSDVSEEEEEEGLATSPPRRPAPVLPPAVHGAASVGSATSSDRMASLYASLAAELREKLSNPDRGPLLLPPKDYGTVCKRSSTRPEGGSKSSSGIGSDELLPRELDSSSDEEWPAQQHRQREQRRNRRPVSFPAATAATAAVFGGPLQKHRQPHTPHRQTQTPQPYRNGQVPHQQRPLSQQQQHPPSHRQSATPRQMVVPESRPYQQHHQPQQQQPEPLRQHNQKRNRDYRHSFVEPSTRRPLPL
ncbi:hypothetical protein HPB50_012779 [Hyalomma asiaticum]|uniref:Uncharacterized protein n=1 Tax=Hyalomma asiaticum TaxID=266040 RepID=A0ACB7SJ49_HYAAI|nr:hypothetical protein HPB50_012779 [Hyalomma asiaticum]